MVSYEQAGRMLDRAVEALPKEIFRELNGGVNLLREARRGENGSYILGLYHNDMMGRYIEIFYGSFSELYGGIPHGQFERRLTSTLHHELTHHIEGLAGDRTLEKWDEEQEALREYMEDPEPLDIGRVLFADDDDTSLAPCAAAFFSRAAAEKCPEVTAGSAGLYAAGERAEPECARLAASMGADISARGPRLLTEELLREYDAVFCMTLAQADEICDRFPGCEEKVMCLAESDILRPKLRPGWKSALRRVASETADLAAQLCLEEDCDDA